MTRIFEGEVFRGWSDRNSSKVFSDLEFRGCHFVGCRVSSTRDPRRRSRVERTTLKDCEQTGCTLDAAIVEDVLVDGLKTNGLFQVWGAVFRHVTLRGNMGRLMISPLVATALATLSQQKGFDIANHQYYESTDWALDIREAAFEEADLRGVPGNLVRRDPESQFVLTRERGLEGRWRNLDLRGTYWRTAIEFFLEAGLDSQVLVAPKKSPRYRPLLAALLALRDAGVVD